MPEHGGALLFTQSLRHKAEDADAPGFITQHLSGFGQQGIDLLTAHQGQGQKWQGTTRSHRIGEGR